MRSRILLPDVSTPLRPETVAKRKFPVNIREHETALFSHDLERHIPGTKLLELKDVRVSPEGILFKQRKILVESFAFPWMWDEWRRDKVLRFFTRNYISRKRSRLDHDALWITDNWSHGYFHWLADALTRLYTVRDLASDLVLLLPEQYNETEFVRQSLKLFKPGSIRFIGRNEVVLCRRLLVPTHTAPSGHYNQEIIQGVRDLVVKTYGDKKESEVNDRIYLSRGRSRRRTIVNESEVVEVLREFGFRMLSAEDLLFAEQVNILSGTRYLVSNHGAGLTNMLFMRPGNSVLELRHQTDHVNNCYFTLASALGLNYFYQTCQPERPGEKPHTANLVVDVRTLRENVELLLG
jgi:capsular polysaccharide biosynthesis protein